MGYAIKKIGTIEQFREFLTTFPRQTWVTKIIAHHTLVPTADQWRGLKSMQGLQNYYEGMGWSAGPTWFVAPDGIWQLSDPRSPGVHSNAANAFGWAVEVVGNFDVERYVGPIAELATAVYGELLLKQNLSLEDLEPHNKYNPTKTCPGRNAPIGLIREFVQNYLNLLTQPEIKMSFTAKKHAPIYEDRSTSSNIALGGTAYTTAGTKYELDNIEDSWVHFANGVGFSEVKNWVNDTIAGYVPFDIKHVVDKLPKQNNEYTEHDKNVIIGYYHSYGLSAQINTYVLVAQLILETNGLRSWWAARPRRNPAGLGVTGGTSKTKPVENSIAWAFDGNLWQKGLSFPTWEAAVQTRIGHMLCYLYEDKDMYPTQLVLSNLSPRKKYVNRASVKTVADLTGKWATDPLYDKKILAIMSKLL